MWSSGMAAKMNSSSKQPSLPMTRRMKACLISGRKKAANSLFKYQIALTKELGLFRSD